MNLSEVLAVHNLQSGLGGVAAGDAGQHVNTAGLQLIQLSLLNDLDVNNGLDGGGLSLEVALELGVDGHGALLGGGVPVGDDVGAGEGVLGDIVTVGSDLSGLHVLVAVLLIEVVGQVAALAVVLHFHTLAQNQAQRIGADSGVGVSEVVGIEVRRHGQAEVVVVEHTYTGKYLAAGAFLAGVGKEVIVAH